MSGQPVIVALPTRVPIGVAVSAPRTVAAGGAAIIERGPQGIQGPAGPQGVQGPPGTGVVFAQPQPALVWIIVHELNRFPSVTIVDTANDQVFGDLSYPDSNTVRVDFTAPVAGSAYLN